MFRQLKGLSSHNTTSRDISIVPIIVNSFRNAYTSTHVRRTNISFHPETHHHSPLTHTTIKQDVSEYTISNHDNNNNNDLYYICGFTGRLVQRRQWDDYLSCKGTIPNENVNSSMMRKEVNKNDMAGVVFELRRLVFSRLGGERGVPRSPSKYSSVSLEERGLLEPYNVFNATECSSSSASYSCNDANLEKNSSTAYNIYNNSNVAISTSVKENCGDNNISGKGNVYATDNKYRASPRPHSAGIEKSAIRLVLEAEDTNPQPPIPYIDLWSHVSRNVKLIDEFNFSKRSKRLSRMNIAAKFLRDHHVILHSVLRWAPVYTPDQMANSSDSYSKQLRVNKKSTLASVTLNSSLRRKGDAGSSANDKRNEADIIDAIDGTPTGTPLGKIEGSWNVSSPFYRVAVVGETLLKSEIALRIAKLFPKMSVATDSEAKGSVSSSFSLTLLPKLTNSCISQESLATLFDECDFGRLVEKEGRRWRPLKSQEKASMVVAIIGELHWFAVRTKATDRTHVNALFPPSDVLIMHVLSTHLIESIVSELLFSHLKPIADVAREHSWPLYPSEMVEHVADMSPRTPASYALSEISRTFDPEKDVLRNLVPELTPPADRSCEKKINDDRTLREEEHHRRCRLLEAQERNTFLAREEAKKKQIEKAKRRLERKIEKHTLATEGSLKQSNTDKTSIDDNLVQLSCEIEKKKKYIIQWEKCQEVRIARFNKMLDAKFLSPSQHPSLGDSSRDKAISCSRDITSLLVSPFPLVKPLLHKHPFGPGSTVRVCQNDVVLNYKKYKQLCVDSAEERSLCNNRKQDMSFSLGNDGIKKRICEKSATIIPSVADYFEMIKM